MTSWKRKLVQLPLLGSILLFFFRLKMAMGIHWQQLKELARWLFGSKEITNFTYDLEELNEKHLALLISEITKKEYNEIMRYIDEIRSNDVLRKHIQGETANGKFSRVADVKVKFARRVGWYAFARALKPKVIVETGVDKGLGSCVLTAALILNETEGFGGRYFGLDIDPEAGYLLQGRFKEHGEMIFGDSVETLRSFEPAVDLFINDSDHSEDYEYMEYETIHGKLSPNAVILGDNAHCTSKLLEFSQKNGRKFLFFGEKPKGHWYPGGGIGVSFK